MMIIIDDDDDTGIEKEWRYTRDLGHNILALYVSLSWCEEK